MCCSEARAADHKVSTSSAYLMIIINMPLALWYVLVMGLNVRLMVLSLI